MSSAPASLTLLKLTRHLLPALALVSVAFATPVSAVPLIDDELQQKLPQPERGDPRIKKAIAAGLAAFKARDLNAAEAAFRSAAQSAPREPVPLLGLAAVADKRGDKSAAERNLKKALELAPKLPIVLVAYARYLLEKGDYKGAVASLDQAIQAEPRSAILFRERGDIYAAPLNDPAKAIESYRQALVIDPNDAATRYALGFALNRVGKFSEAKVELVSATQLTPANPLAWAALGTAELGLGEYQQAQVAFETAIKLEPKFWGAQMGRGDALAGLDKIDDAAAAYNAAMQLDKRSVLPHLRMGIMLQRAGKLEEAEPHYSAALSIKANDPDALNNLAFLLAERNTKLDEALRLAEKAVKLAPAVLAYQDTLAWVYRARDDLTSAQAILEKITAAGPNPDFEYHLGVVYSEQHKDDEAIAAFDRALKLAPTFRAAREAREKLAGPG